MTALIAHRPADNGRPYRRLLGVCRRRSRWAAVRIRRAARARGRSDAGMTTAEYAVGTVAACALAAVLYKVVTSTAIVEALTEVITRALHAS